jgi:hypothetical protein
MWLVLALPPLLVPALAFEGPGEEPPLPPWPTQATPIETMEVRIAVLSRGLGMVEGYYRSRVEPVERMLLPYHPDADFVRSVAIALVREAGTAGLDPRVLASILLVENTGLDPGAVSSAGAVGLMQVMPFHAGSWGCGGDDLTSVAVNLCHGARIFAAYLARHRGDLDRALLAYNGCVRGSNTADCHLYPSHVYSRAGRAAMRGWLQLE